MVDVSARARRHETRTRSLLATPVGVGTVPVLPGSDLFAPYGGALPVERSADTVGLPALDPGVGRGVDRSVETVEIPLVVPGVPEPPTEPVAIVVPVEEAAAPDEPTPAPGRRRRVEATPRRGLRLLVAAVVLTLACGSLAALAVDKTVVVTVDGIDRVVHTFGHDVAAALASAGLRPAPQDRVEPALPTELADGDHVIVDRARRLTLQEGAGTRDVWTTASSLRAALDGLGVDALAAQLSLSPDTSVPLNGITVALRMPRTVTLTDGTGAPVPVTTEAGTVTALLAERGIQLGPDDVSVPSGDTALEDGTTVQVVRNGVGEIVEILRIPAPEEIVEDPELPRGEKVVEERGKAGERSVVIRVHVQNGKEIRREQVRAGGVTPPEPRIVRVGTNDELTAPAVEDGGVWDRLAKCETTGNWAINSGNGYYGGLQFNAPTWRAYGGDDYAPLPHQASREEQIAIATKVRDDRGGYGAWPACSAKLGLPR